MWSTSFKNVQSALIGAGVGPKKNEKKRLGRGATLKFVSEDGLVIYFKHV